MMVVSIEFEKNGCQTVLSKICEKFLKDDFHQALPFLILLMKKSYYLTNK